jgi:hypothetical protein
VRWWWTEERQWLATCTHAYTIAYGHTHIYAHSRICTRSACTHDANIHSLLHTHAADTPLNTQTIRVNAFDPLVSEKSMQSRILFGKVLEGQVLRNPQIEQIRSARTPVVIGFHEEELNLPNHSTTANTTQGCEETRNKTHTHTHTFTHSHSLSLTLTCTHTHTHTHTYTYTYTRLQCGEGIALPQESMKRRTRSQSDLRTCSPVRSRSIEGERSRIAPKRERARERER